MQAAAASHSRQRRQRMPLARTLPSCDRHAIKYEIIELNLICIIAQLVKKTSKIWTIDFFF